MRAALIIASNSGHGAWWIGLPVIEGQHFAITVASVGVLGFEPSHPETMAIELWNFSPSGQKWS